MAKRYALGIDVGASGIRGVVFDGKQVLRRLERAYSHRPRTKRKFWAALFGFVDSLRAGLPQKELAGIGFGMPAAIEKGRRAWRPGNLGVIDELDVYAPLKTRYKTKIVITNDAKAAAFAEYRLGAGKGHDSLFMFTLGSGTGGGYVKNGLIQAGAFDTAFEVGSPIVEAAESIKRKRRIKLEYFMSEKFFLRRGINPFEAAKRARRGDRKMKNLWKLFGSYAGIGVANIMVMLEPHAIVIGGSMADAWPLFAPSMKKIVRQFVPSPLALKKTKILKAKLSNDAGAIGAALLILEHHA